MSENKTTLNDYIQAAIHIAPKHATLVFTGAKILLFNAQNIEMYYQKLQDNVPDAGFKAIQTGIASTLLTALLMSPMIIGAYAGDKIAKSTTKNDRNETEEKYHERLWVNRWLGQMAGVVGGAAVIYGVSSMIESKQKEVSTAPANEKFFAREITERQKLSTTIDWHDAKSALLLPEGKKQKPLPKTDISLKAS